MLVFTRKMGDEIFIGDNIKIKVLNVGHTYIRLGIEAPKDLEVNRDNRKTDKEGKPIPKRDATQVEENDR